MKEDNFCQGFLLFGFVIDLFLMWRTDVTVSIKRFGRSATKNKSFISTVILFSTHIQAKHWRLGNISYHNYFNKTHLKITSAETQKYKSKSCTLKLPIKSLNLFFKQNKTQFEYFLLSNTVTKLMVEREREKCSRQRYWSN